MNDDASPDVEQLVAESEPSSQAADLPPTESLPHSTGEHVVIRRFRLEVVSGPDAPLAIVSRSERLAVGTHPSADLRLTDRTVSRFHCELTIADDRVVLRDLGSRNGTRINGVPVVVAPLEAGAVLEVGSTHISFRLGSEDLRVPLAAGDRFGLAVGTSAVMRAAFATLERAAQNDTTVLLTGDTGSGKDLLAESIHQQSARADGPFVVVDCGALPSALLESELFGHERGAFTGADRERVGAFEAAAGGTVFLDEIGELDLDLQPKLLRVLERREVRRVGDAHPIPLDVRFVAATSRNLRNEVNASRFRSDLYYRLAVIEVNIPPLRERKEDIPRLAEELLDRLAPADPETRARILTGELLGQLARHHWPGNVRELRNYLERCLTLEEPPEAPTSHTDTVMPSVDPTLPIAESRERWIARFERSYLEELLHRTKGNVTEAARVAGVSRMQLYRLLWRAGLR